MKKLAILLIVTPLVLACNFFKQDTPEKHNPTPEWFKDAKLGIYFHWGIYTVPAFGNEWYAYNMYRPNGEWTIIKETVKHHTETWGENFEYHEFAPLFKAEKFDAKEWAKLFKSAGARFAGPVAIHHDGYALWDSKINPWNAKDIGPEKDLLGELFSAIRNEDMRTIATFHHARNLQRYAKDTANWEKGFDSHFAYNPNRATSSTDSKLKYLYGNIDSTEFNNYWLEQIREVVEGYSPDIIWFDSWLDCIVEDYRKQMIALQYNNKKESVIVRKQDDLPISSSVLDIEQGGMIEMPEQYWMTDITISDGSWSYVEGLKYKDTDLILRNMIDVWSKKGIVLLNISPRSDGVIPVSQQKILHKLGHWLSINGEAVYGTRSYSIYGYGNADHQDGHFGGQSATMQYSNEDVRFTRSKDGNTIYAFVLGMPNENSQFTLNHIKNGTRSIKQVSVLNSNTKVKYNLYGTELTITTPSAKLMNNVATVFKIEY